MALQLLAETEVGIQEVEALLKIGPATVEVDALPASGYSAAEHNG